MGEALLESLIIFIKRKVIYYTNNISFVYVFINVWMLHVSAEVEYGAADFLYIFATGNIKFCRFFSLTYVKSS